MRRCSSSAPAMPWTVKPDPLPFQAAGAFDTRTSVQVGDWGAQFPSTPSPFAALSPVPPKGEEAVFQVYDLRTMSISREEVPRRADCPVCGTGAPG